MTRIFFSLKEFDTLWKGIGFDDGDLRELETFLIVNPQYGKVTSGTGGLRKMRWALPGMGKSGGIRISNFEHRFAVGFKTKPMGGVRNLSGNITIVCEDAGTKSYRGKQDRTLTMKLFEVTGSGNEKSKRKK